MINKYVILLIFSVLIASVSQIILKKGADKKYESFIQEYLNKYVIFGYTLMIISTLLTILGLSQLEYKNAPIIETVGYIFVMFLSWKFLKEKITKKKLLGNGLILIGIIVFYL